jgi:ATP-binding cassette subfamily F protein 3
MMMLSRANLLVLDEPTNHLDVESIEALEDAIERYEGTVILVSHDRALLRALATRVWVLHDRHVTDFDGSFAEWEVVSEERAHAASVLASEEEALRRVKEKQKTERRAAAEKSTTGRQRTESREARRALERAEGEVARLEAEVARLSATLEDPELYTKPDGAKRAASIGAELERAKKALDQALEAWTAAVEQVEVPS